MATIPTRRVARAPIQSRPRVRRWTMPDSANPETATAVRPTASGTNRAGIGVLASPRERAVRPAPRAGAVRDDGGRPLARGCGRERRAGAVAAARLAAAVAAGVIECSFVR